jgi:hypothetical protein
MLVLGTASASAQRKGRERGTGREGGRKEGRDGEGGETDKETK